MGISARFFCLTTVKPQKIKSTKINPRIPERDLVKSKVIKKIIEAAEKIKKFLDFILEFEIDRAQEIGINANKKAASQLGWPRVEKTLF